MKKEISQMMEYLEGLTGAMYSVYIFNNEYVRVSISAPRIGMPLVKEFSYTSEGIQNLIQEVKHYFLQDR